MSDYLFVVVEVAATAHDPNDYDTDDEIDIAQGATGGGSKPSAFTPSGPASVTTRENVTVTIVKGMLAQQNVCVIDFNCNVGYRNFNVSRLILSYSFWIP